MEETELLSMYEKALQNVLNDVRDDVLTAPQQRTAEDTSVRIEELHNQLAS